MKIFSRKQDYQTVAAGQGAHAPQVSMRNPKLTFIGKFPTLEHVSQSVKFGKSTRPCSIRLMVDEAQRNAVNNHVNNAGIRTGLPKQKRWDKSNAVFSGARKLFNRDPDNWNYVFDRKNPLNAMQRLFGKKPYGYDTVIKRKHPEQNGGAFHLNQMHVTEERIRFPGFWTHTVPAVRQEFFETDLVDGNTGLLSPLRHTGSVAALNWTENYRIHRQLEPGFNPDKVPYTPEGPPTPGDGVTQGRNLLVTSHGRKLERLTNIREDLTIGLTVPYGHLSSMEGGVIGDPNHPNTISRKVANFPNACILHRKFGNTHVAAIMSPDDALNPLPTDARALFRLAAGQDERPHAIRDALLIKHGVRDEPPSSLVNGGTVHIALSERERRLALDVGRAAINDKNLDIAEVRSERQGTIGNFITRLRDGVNIGQQYQLVLFDTCLGEGRKGEAWDPLHNNLPQNPTPTFVAWTEGDEDPRTVSVEEATAAGWVNTMLPNGLPTQAAEDDPMLTSTPGKALAYYKHLDDQWDDTFGGQFEFNFD